MTCVISAFYSSPPRKRGSRDAMGRAARTRHHRRWKQPTGYPMPRPNDLSRSLAALDEDSTLIAVIEMSQSSWLVAGIVPGVERHPAKKLEPSEAGLRRRLHRWREEAEKAGRTIDRIAVAFEAGRDGFWPARWLRAHGIEAGACPGEGRGDPPEQHRRLERTSPGKNRSARHGAAETELSRLAAWRAGTLQHGGDPEPGRGGRQAAEPRAREPRRRTHAHRQPDQEHARTPRHPRLQADRAHDRAAARAAAHAGRGAGAA